VAALARDPVGGMLVDPKQAPEIARVDGPVL
jgi:YHS domain-containing protein